MLGIISPLVLSPMVDVTDAAFRSIAKEWGADVTCSEMVSAVGLVHGNQKTWNLVQPWQDESPYGVQIMGGNADEMAAAVSVVCERVKPDFIDLNLGCPSPNILRSCAGGFLLRDPKHAGRVIEAAVDAANCPVSVKLRTGHDEQHLTYIEVGQEAQAAGAAWTTLHGRTVVQGYAGKSNWERIGNLVDALDIPVIGNGDLNSGADVVAMRDQTNCHGFFIARAAMHDPTIFSRMQAALRAGAEPAPPDMAVRLQTFLTYMERAQAIGIDHIGDYRRQGTRFVSGGPGAKKLRAALHEARTLDELEAVVRANLDG
jgi:tRNA-dihydrouridine synthase B